MQNLIVTEFKNTFSYSFVIVNIKFFSLQKLFLLFLSFNNYNTIANPQKILFLDCSTSKICPSKHYAEEVGHALNAT